MLRNLIALVAVAFLGGGGYVAWRHWHEKDLLLAEREQELAERAAIIDRLSRSTRVAQAMVIDRWQEDGRTWSRVRFVEVDDEGSPLAARTLVVEGETLYFDALVLKFDHERVGAGAPGRERSVLLFRRIFGEHQKPSEGVKLDEREDGGVPDAFRAGRKPTPVEVELWRDFWRYADDPDAAAAAGVRVAQGEAPYTRLQQGKVYELQLDHAGGLNIVVSKVPAVLMVEEN